MKTIFLILAIITGASVQAAERPYERSVLCNQLVAQYSDLISGEGKTKILVCRRDLFFVEDGEKLFVSLYSEPYAIFCPVESSPSKSGITLGQCEVTERKPRMGISN